MILLILHKTYFSEKLRLVCMELAQDPVIKNYLIATSLRPVLCSWRHIFSGKSVFTASVYTSHDFVSC